MRVAAAGHDAATAPLQHLLFAEYLSSLKYAQDFVISLQANVTVGIPLPLPGRVPPILVIETGGANNMFVNLEATAFFIRSEANGLARIRIFNYRIT
ncbi:MAG: hypothetical protein V7704_19455 [Aurantimonas endophytica]|uniref:hypothetical protein n=1 Tax=Aurantimonas endophytica TaxID=1522175 RepID=UPI0030028054